MSTARMSFGHGSAKADLQLAQRFASSAFREKRGVDFLRGMRSSPPDHYSLPILLPLQHGARREAELAPNFDGHGDLTLGRQFRGREGHTVTLPR